MRSDLPPVSGSSIRLNSPRNGYEPNVAKEVAYSTAISGQLTTVSDLQIHLLATGNVAKFLLGQFGFAFLALRLDQIVRLGAWCLALTGFVSAHTNSLS